MTKTYHVETMSKKAFDGLPTYNTSLPTSPRIGFKWKCRRPVRDDGNPPDWYMGEAVHIHDVRPDLDPEKEVGIIWCRIEVKS